MSISSIETKIKPNKKEQKKKEIEQDGKFTEKNVINHALTHCGKTLSTVSTSLENRFNIRPMGVVSNNHIAHRSTFINKLSCIDCADRIKPIDTINEITTLSKTDQWVKKIWKKEIKQIF